MVSSLRAREVGSVGPLSGEGTIGVPHTAAPCEAGGLERVVHALATAQRRAGHRVSVVAVLPNGREDHPFLPPLIAAGVEVVPVRLRPRAYLRERAAVIEICRRIRPDVVHTHGYRADVIDASAARRLGVPTVTTVHGFAGGDLKNRFYEWLQRWAFRRFDAVVAVSRPLAADLARAGVPVQRLHVVPNAWPEGDPPLPRDRARRMLAVPEGRFHVGWVGRLSPEKGPDVLLAALESLSDLPLAVSVLGDGRSRAPLEALAARRGLAQRVRWFGNQPDARRLFSAFDVFVLSSRTEGTPMVVFEAMAAGAPIVATAVGGVPDIVSSAEGALVPANDAIALAAAIRAVYRNPAAAAAQARAARNKLARDFGVEPWLRRYRAIYQSVCHRARRRALAGR